MIAVGAAQCSVLSSLARTWLRAAKARGVASTGLVDDTLRARLEDADGRIPYDTFMRLVEELSARSGDPSFGLHVAEDFVDAATFGVVGFAARSCNTLGEAIERTVRHTAIMNENTEIRLERRGGRAVITDGPIAPLTWPRHYAEMALASFACLSRKWTERPVDVLQVRFRHAAPADVAEHERLFGVRPEFSRPLNQLVLPVAVLDAPLRFADVDLRVYLDTHAANLTRALGPAGDAVARLRNAIHRALPTRAPTLSDAARAIGMSARTLQRRLAAEGHTYHAILDSVRMHAATTALAVPGTSVQEAAFLSGYVDLKAFRRAFRRWTGVSPKAYRNDSAATPRASTFDC